MNNENKTIIQSLNLHKDTEDLLKSHPKATLHKSRRKENANKMYDKEKYIYVYDGYNAFENFMFVRSYIQKKYKMPLNLLEILLYLYPKNIFSQSDLGEVPKQFKYCRTHHLIDLGYVEVTIQGKGKRRSLYSLSNQGKRVVHTFYEMLAGVKEIPINHRVNPLMTSGFAYDKKMMDLIIKTQELNKKQKNG